VRCETLDSWWHTNAEPPVRVIKIDTEGSELLILRGGKGCIQQTRPSIYLEVEPRNMKPYGLSASNLWDYFESIGYTLATLDGQPFSESGEFVRSVHDGHDSYVARPH